MTTRRPTEPPATPLRRAVSMLFTALIFAAVVFLWPARLGGSTRLVIVSGESMEPTYDLGDIVVARNGAHPAVGKTVVFAVPDGSAEGMLVIHRIIERDADGFFHTQGDNRDTPDQWKLTEDDIVGSPVLRIPRGGVAIKVAQQWWVIAILAGLIVMFTLWPSDDEPSDTEPSDTEPSDTESSGETTPAPVSILSEPFVGVETVEIDWHDLIDFDESESLLEPSTHSSVSSLDMLSWSDREIDSDQMDDAIAWLDAELATLPHLAAKGNPTPP